MVWFLPAIFGSAVTAGAVTKEGREWAGWLYDKGKYALTKEGRPGEFARAAADPATTPKPGAPDPSANAPATKPDEYSSWGPYAFIGPALMGILSTYLTTNMGTAGKLAVPIVGAVIGYMIQNYMMAPSKPSQQEPLPAPEPGQ